MNININDFTNAFLKAKLTDVTKIFFILNNCEVIGKITEIYENDNINPVDEPIKFHLFHYFKHRKKINEERKTNFNMILLKNAKVRYNSNNVYIIKELLINTDTINTVIFLNDDNEPF